MNLQYWSTQSVTMLLLLLVVALAVPTSHSLIIKTDSAEPAVISLTEDETGKPDKSVSSDGSDGVNSDDESEDEPEETLFVDPTVNSEAAHTAEAQTGNVNMTDVLEGNVTAANTLNLRPIIGILSQEPGRSMRKALVTNETNYLSYIAASYVKSIESAGARVVPILINKPVEYYRKLVTSLNGIVFPGGSASITNTSGYGTAGDILYQMVLESNKNGNPMPLWSTCLGFEMLVYLAAGRIRPLTKCSAQNTADPLHLEEGWQTSRLWSKASEELMEAVQTQNITSNFHKYCVTPETFVNMSVSDDYNLLSTNFDKKGSEYVSTIEHKEFPIFGTQWHPEKNTFEWKLSTIPHTPEAVALEQYVMEIFVGEARRNFNQFSSPEEEADHLIYNYTPEYVAKIYRSSFQQCYFFCETDNGKC